MSPIAIGSAASIVLKKTAVGLTGIRLTNGKDKTMRRIIKILMERDDMTEAEATDLFNEGKEALDDCIERGALLEAEDITIDYFDLEPDYLEDILF